MRPHAGWRELYRCDELSRAGVVATSIAAMEFDVRLRDAGTGRYLDQPGSEGEPRRGPYAVETRAGDWEDLASVLDAIIEEQSQFDAYLLERDRRTGRAQRSFLLLLIVVVGVLAIMGLIEV